MKRNSAEPDKKNIGFYKALYYARISHYFGFKLKWANKRFIEALQKQQKFNYLNSFETNNKYALAM